jgi:hypothetical protein
MGTDLEKTTTSNNMVHHYEHDVVQANANQYCVGLDAVCTKVCGIITEY